MTLVTLPRPERTGDRYFDVAAARSALAAGEPVAFPPFEVVHLTRYGLSVCLNMRQDPVQRALRRGEFYEIEDLRLLSQHLRKGAHIIDIGANIGNHALYFAGQMQAARVVTIEPNPLALAPLVANVVLNRLGDVIDLGHLGLGLSDRAAGGFGMKRHDRNLGATRMRPGEGDLQVVPGDNLFGQETPDLMKIDVEGMEIQVLSGLSQTIARTRPLLLVEVDQDNDMAFETWCAAQDYVPLGLGRTGRTKGNRLVQPRERASS